MPSRCTRPVAVVVALGALLTAPTVKACTIVRTPKQAHQAERAAYRKADLVVTVDAISESYMAAPGPQMGFLRVGVGRGRVLQVHKGARSQNGEILNYLVADGEDSVSCPALSSTRPGQRYKLYLVFGPGAGPPMILYRDPFFD
jgi:hypothetical protein